VSLVRVNWSGVGIISGTDLSGLPEASHCYCEMSAFYLKFLCTIMAHLVAPTVTTASDKNQKWSILVRADRGSSGKNGGREGGPPGELVHGM